MINQTDTNLYVFKDLCKNIVYTTKLIKCFDKRGFDEEEAITFILRGLKLLKINQNAFAKVRGWDIKIKSIYKD